MGYVTFWGWSVDFKGKLFIFSFMIVTLIFKIPIAAAAPGVDVNCGASGSFTIQDGRLKSATANCTGAVVIPASTSYTTGGGTTVADPTTVVDPDVFSGLTGITSVTFPNTLTTISSNVFKNATGLTSIIFPSSLRTIGDSAFYGTTSLTSMTIPSGVTTMGNSVFYGAAKLTSVTLPNSLTSIGASAFYGATGLTSIILPSSLITLGDSVFFNARSLTSLTIPSSVTSIGASAFYDARSLTSLTIPSSITSIGATAFYGATSLISLTIPSSVTSIGSEAFYGTTNLTSVTFGASSNTLTISLRAFCGVNSTIVSYIKATTGQLIRCVPSAPINVAVAQLTSNYAVIFFTSPINDGGSTIESYTLVSDPGGLTATISQYGSGLITITGLSSATAYRFNFYATNIAGNSPTVTTAQFTTPKSAEEIAAAIKSAKENLFNFLKSFQTQSIEAFKSASYKGVTEEYVYLITKKILSLPITQRANADVIEKIIRQVVFFNPEIPPTVEDFEVQGFINVKEKFIKQLGVELLLVPLVQQGDINTITEIIRRVEIVDRLSTPATAKTVRSSMLVAIGAISGESTKKETITRALQKLPPERIDTYQKVLLEVAKQEAIIKARTDRTAINKSKNAARNISP